MKDERDDAHAPDPALDRLVKRAGDTQPGDAALPEGDAVAAYLSGFATEAEAGAVRAALGASPGFRRDVVEAIRETESLEEPRARAAWDAEPPAAERGAVRRTGVSLLEAAAAFVRGALRPWPGGVLAAAAIIALVLVTRQGRDAGAEWTLVEPTALTWEAENFAPFALRGEDGAAPPPGATEEEVALYALRRRVTFRDGRYVIDAAPSAPPPQAAGGRSIEICLRDESGRCGRVARIGRPAGADGGLHAFLAVRVAPDSLALRSFDVTSDRLAVLWPAAGTLEGVVTLTGRAGDGFVAAPPVPLGPSGR
jgi:hypothetical protein